MRSVFSHVSMLKTNVETQNKQEEFSCKVFWSTFSKILILEIRIEKDSAEKPLSCEVCGSTFTQNASYKDHIRINI